MGSLLFTSIILVFSLETCFSDSCSKVFTSKSGVIENPRDSNQQYPDNADCTYTIRSNASAHYIHFLWERFDLEKNYDYLYIDNQNFTGGIQPWYSRIYHFNNYITLRFTSDHYVHEYGGFSIRYSMIQGDVSFKIYTAQSGLIESPKGTNSAFYPDNARFLHIIRGSSHTPFVQFKFETFDLDKAADFLYLGNEKLTGNKTGHEVGCSVNNNDLSLLFTSNGSEHHYAGFTIRYWMMTDCEAGYYGLNCTSRCSTGCSDVCNKETGSCHCKVGWTGANCDEACPSGTYDSYCTKFCSPGCVDGSCNKEDGSCSCRPGYTGDTCRNECQAGHYGVNCTSGCSSGCSDDCDKESGRCTCKPGWTDTKCEAAALHPVKAAWNVKLIAGVTGGSLGFILLVTALILIFCFIRKRKAKDEATKKTNNSKEMKHVESSQRQAVSSDEEPVYDMPIDEDDSKKRLRYEGLKYSTDQRSGTSQPVIHVISADEDNETKYVNVSLSKQNLAKKAVRGGRNKGKQCYENYAMESKT